MRKQPRIAALLAVVCVLTLSMGAASPTVGAASPTAVAQAAGAHGSVGVVGQATRAEARIGGANRYETAAAVAIDTFPDGADSVVLVSGQLFSDAVAAAGFAGSVSAPVLLTARDHVPQATLTALGELQPSTVHAVGGRQSVSDAVVEELATRWRVERLAGADRHATSARLADEMAARPAGAAGIGTLGDLRTAVIATGSSFPDALAAGPLAYARALPILLVEADLVPADVRGALEDLGVQQVLIVGGEQAVSEEVQKELEALVGYPALRLAGASRYTTSARVAAFTLEALNEPGSDMLLASGRDFADAAAAAPWAARGATAMLLAPHDDLPASAARVLLRYDGVLERVRAVGGEQALAADVVAAAQRAVEVDPAEVVNMLRLSWVGVVGDDGAFLGGQPGAVGTARLRLEPSKGVIVYDVDLGSLHATSPTITLRRAGIGARGPVLWTLRRNESPRVAEPWSGVLFEDEADGAVTVDDLVARPEEFYLAVASGDAPQAALMRGQLPDGGWTHVATEVGAITVPLDASHVVDTAGGEPVFGTSHEPGTAEVRLSFDLEGQRLLFAIDASGLEGSLAGAAGVQLRSGGIGSTGTVVATLVNGDELAANGGTVSGSITQADFSAGVSLVDVFASQTAFHLVIATTAEPAAAVRGQLPDGGMIPTGE